MNTMNEEENLAINNFNTDRFCTFMSAFGDNFVSLQEFSSESPFDSRKIRQWLAFCPAVHFPGGILSGGHFPMWHFVRWHFVRDICFCGIFSSGIMSGIPSLDTVSHIQKSSKRLLEGNGMKY